MTSKWVWKYLSGLSLLHLYVFDLKDCVLEVDNDCVRVSDNTNSIHIIPIPKGFTLPVEHSVSSIEEITIYSWKATNSETMIADFGEKEKIPEKVECLSCCNLLFTPSQFTVKELPSEYWREMVDFWSCHKQEFASVAKGACDDSLTLLPATKNTLLYSDNYYLLHSSAPCSVTTDGKCIHCLYELGSAGGCIKVSKSRTKQGSSIESSIYKQILESMQAHSSFHYTLNSSTSALCLQLVNWTCMIMTPEHPGMRNALVLKVTDGKTCDGEDIQVFEDELNLLSALLVSRQLFDNLTFLVNA